MNVASKLQWRLGIGQSYSNKTFVPKKKFNILYFATRNMLSAITGEKNVKIFMCATAQIHFAATRSEHEWYKGNFETECPDNIQILKCLPYERILTASWTRTAVSWPTGGWIDLFDAIFFEPPASIARSITESPINYCAAVQLYVTKSSCTEYTSVAIGLLRLATLTAGSSKVAIARRRPGDSSSGIFFDVMSVDYMVCKIL